MAQKKYKKAYKAKNIRKEKIKMDSTLVYIFDEISKNAQTIAGGIVALCAVAIVIIHLIWSKK